MTRYSKGQGAGTGAAIFALFLSNAALAITPPPAPPSYAAYGPLRVCAPNFALTIAADEAVHASGDIVRTLGQTGALAVKYDGLDAGSSTWSTPRPVPGRSGWTMARLTSPTPDAGRTLMYAPLMLRDTDIRYALFAAGDDKPDLIVGASAFDGTVQDAQKLGGISLGAQPDSDACVKLAAALSDRDYARTQGAADEWAAIFPRDPESGPLFHCINGVGFPLGAADKIHRPWKSLGADGPLFIDRSGHGIKLEQRGGERIRQSDGASSGKHPVGWLRNTALSYHPSRGVGPPYAPAGVPEPARWSVDIDHEGYWKTGLAISFTAGDAAASGFAFVETLEIVDPEDTRCVR